jgi:hypothetical protein
MYLEKKKVCQWVLNCEHPAVGNFMENLFFNNLREFKPYNIAQQKKVNQRPVKDKDYEMAEVERRPAKTIACLIISTVPMFNI